MKYNGKKFSEIILEQDPDFKSATLSTPNTNFSDVAGEFGGLPVHAKLTGYNKQGEPEYELPGVTLKSKSTNNRVKLQFNISKDGGVDDIKTKSTTSKPPIS